MESLENVVLRAKELLLTQDTLGLTFFVLIAWLGCLDLNRRDEVAIDATFMRRQCQSWLWKFVLATLASIWRYGEVHAASQVGHLRARYGLEKLAKDTKVLTRGRHGRIVQDLCFPRQRSGKQLFNLLLVWRVFGIGICTEKHKCWWSCLVHKVQVQDHNCEVKRFLRYIAGFSTDSRFLLPSS